MDDPLMRLGDTGPVYVETELGRFPVEPWNAASNIVFLITLIYWAWRTRLSFRDHPLIVSALPILAIGWFGGTMYHALRDNPLWLMMDVQPILILALLASVYFCRRIFRNWGVTGCVSLSPLVAFRVATGILQIPPRWVVAVAYAAVALTILIPASLHCLVRHRPLRGWLLAAFICFALALAFRQSDAWFGTHLLPMGSHFLWHVCGGISAFLVLKYTYESDRQDARLPAASA